MEGGAAAVFTSRPFQRMLVSVMYLFLFGPVFADIKDQGCLRNSMLL